MTDTKSGVYICLNPESMSLYGEGLQRVLDMQIERHRISLMEHESIPPRTAWIVSGADQPVSVIRIDQTFPPDLWERIECWWQALLADIRLSFEELMV